MVLQFEVVLNIEKQGLTTYLHISLTKNSPIYDLPVTTESEEKNL